MSAHDFSIFALQVALMLACALAGGYLMRRIHQPAVLGEMLVGVFIGPTVLGTLAPDMFAELFPATGATALVRGGMIKLGMLFFLFTVGLEIHLADVARVGYRALVIGSIGSVVPLLGGIGAVYAFPDIWGPQAAQNRFIYGLFIGAAMANTANPVLARILLELNLLKANIGTTLMTATIVDDLISWSLLAVVFSEFSPNTPLVETAHAWNSVLVVLFFVGILVAGRYLSTPLLHWVRRHVLWPSGFIAVLCIMVLISAALAEELGIHAFLGPFLLGVALAPTQEQEQAFDVVNHFVMSFFVPLYFVSLGLSANFATHFDWVLVLLITGVACTTKLSSVFVGARLSGLDRRTSLAVGFGMNARGAIGVLLAALGREHGVINEPVYVALVLMAILTSLIASPAMKMLLPSTRDSGQARST